MFGHQDDRHDHDDEPHQDSEADAGVATSHPDNDGQHVADHAGQDHDDHAAPADNGGAPDDTGHVQGNPQGDDDDWQHPGEPIDDSSDDNPGQISDIISPAGGHNPGAVPHMPTPPRDLTDNDNDDAKVPHELIDIKQKALGGLTPLIDKLDQTPEDRFRTLMMMIQASDDQGLIKQAYEAANSIEDEKIKGQALVDIVNEINYFTQHPKS